MNQRVKKVKMEEDSSGAWALSYGDMMTLLLTFFVLIVSFSNTELIKFRQAMGSLQGTKGVLMEQDGSAVISKQQDSFTQPLDQETMLRMLKEIEDKVFEMNAGNSVNIEINQEGLIFRIDTELMFESGQAQLNPEVYYLLEAVSEIIRRFDCEIRVEGHTDNTPISTGRYPSNWELSIGRAMSVIRYFVDVSGISPKRMVAVGAGEHRPLVPNDTPQNRRRNRRVEIVLDWGDLFEAGQF